MPVLNLTKKTWLATKIKRADNFFTRLIGLLWREKLGPEEALWLVPNRGVHTIGMKFPIDVVFLDKQNKVVSMIPSLAPYRMSSIYPTAYSVLELPSGAIHKSATEVGDQLEISLAESSEIDDLKETQLNRIG
jgi:uncharacterized membrane protein (UPF0127 family)